MAIDLRCYAILNDATTFENDEPVNETQLGARRGGGDDCRPHHAQRSVKLIGNRCQVRRIYILEKPIGDEDRRSKQLDSR